MVPHCFCVHYFVCCMRRPRSRFGSFDVILVNLGQYVFKTSFALAFYGIRVASLGFANPVEWTDVVKFHFQRCIQVHRETSLIRDRNSQNK